MEKQRKKFKMPSTYGTLAAFIILVALLSWVVPGGTYEYVDPTADKLQPIAGSYQPAESNPQNLFDVLAAPINGFLYHSLYPGHRRLHGRGRQIRRH